MPDLPGGPPRQDGDLDGDDTILHHLKLSRGGVGDVEDATVVQGFEGDPVVDPKLYFAVVVQVANADARIERQIVVGRGELIAVERLAASGRLPVECVAVPACQTAAYVAVGSAADRGAGAAASEHGHDEAGEEHPPIHERPEYHGVTLVNLCSGRRAGARSLGQKTSAARCRSIDTLWPLLGEALQSFSPDACRHYFQHCGGFVNLPAAGGVVAQIKCEVERDPDETGGMKSRVHPKYKTKYRVRNWASYERALIGRGNITIWLSRAAIAAWKPEGTRTRGAPPKYSDLAIETALTLRLLFHLPLRQAEGFLTSLFHLMGLDLRSPDHTTLSRRGQHLNLTLRRVPRRAALHLCIDSTGLSMVGEGEWAAAKHGRRGRRGWKKLHLGVDQAGVIVAQALTASAVDDASTGLDLIETIASSARTVTADAAYDTLAVYETANTRGTTVVVPPAKTATLSRRNPRSSARDGTIRRISKIGRRRWKKEVGYHRQARVENAFFRYTSILGDRLRRRTRAAQAVESVLACNVLNRMTELGRPESCAIDR